jgi:hypothetical protein
VPFWLIAISRYLPAPAAALLSSISPPSCLVLHRARILAAYVSAFVLIGAIATKAQIIVPATDDTMIGQNIAQLKGTSLPLIAKGAGAPTGSVWIASTQSGLLIYGVVQEQEPHFAVGRADLPDVELYGIANRLQRLLPTFWEDRKIW